MDYKDTLLMPKTSFPMRGGLPNKTTNSRRVERERFIQ